MTTPESSTAESVIFADQAVEDFKTKCHACGLAVTEQRVAVYRHLISRKDHPTADQVFDGLGCGSAISRATVYRVLETLAKYGLILRLAQPGSVSRFDGTVCRHPHLVCSECGSVVDLDFDELGVSGDKVNRFFDDCLSRCPDGVSLSDYTVVFNGVCAQCVHHAK